MQGNTVSNRGTKNMRRLRINMRATILIALMAMAISPLAADSLASYDAVGSPSAIPAKPDQAAQIRAVESYGRLPLGFEVNKGQAALHIKFLTRGQGYTLHLTPTGAVLALGKTEQALPGNTIKGSPGSTARAAIKMRILGLTATPKITGQNELPGKVNYFIGNNPDKWHSNIPTFSRVRYESVYPGIDLVYYGRQGQLEYDFIISPGFDPNVIRLAFDGADKISLDENGNLILETATGKVIQQRPKIYQDIAGRRRDVSGGYVLSDENEVAFIVAAYDREHPLIIDPVLVYSTYLGGTFQDRAYGIAVDTSGNAYITGYTGPDTDEFGNPLGNPWENDFPVSASAVQHATSGYNDVFVTKLNAAGTAIVYSTYLGGSQNDHGYDIDVDTSGSAYVTGYTRSSNFPLANAFQGPPASVFSSAFVTKLNSTGSSLLYSTYLGGNGFDNSRAYGLAVDSMGQAHVTGYTSNEDFPTVNPYQGTMEGGVDVFVSKFNAAGSDLIFSTFLGGSENDIGLGITLDSSGDVYVTGHTTSNDFPTLNPVQPDRGGLEGIENDAFVTKLDSSGSILVYSTYLGGSNSEQGYNIVVDSSGNSYVTGYTMSTDFPTANPFQSTLNGTRDAFLTKLNNTGSALIYSTFLGGSGKDYSGFRGIALNASGEVYLTGGTSSADFPLAAPSQAISGGDFDVFLTKFNATGNALVNSTYFGGSGFEIGGGLALDSQENIYIAGYTDSWDFPTIYPSFKGGYGGGQYDAFVTKFAPGTGVPATTYHSADYSPSDWEISLSELQRTIDLYGGGSYQCDSNSEDEYAPGAGDENCVPHNSDYNPQDWSINLSELLRVIQFYNLGGGYRLCPEGEDGYCPGPASTSEANERGRWALAAGKFMESNDYFTEALELIGSAAPADADTANFFYALTILAAIGLDTASDHDPDNGLETVGDILDAFGASEAGREKDWWREEGLTILFPDDIAVSAPTGRELQTWLYEVVRPVLEDSINRLALVSADFSADWKIPYTAQNETYFIDYTEVVVYRALLRFFLGSIQIQYAYNLDVNFYDLDNLNADRDPTVEEVLGEYPGLLTRMGEYTALLAAAKGQLASMSDDLIMAINLLQARGSGGEENYLLELDSVDIVNSEQTKTDITKFKTALDGDATIEDHGIISTINLSPFFAGLLDIRAFMPDFAGDDPVEGAVLPDGTLGGMVDPPLILRHITSTYGYLSTTSSSIEGYGTVTLDSQDTLRRTGTLGSMSNTGLDLMFSGAPWELYPDYPLVGRSWNSRHSIDGQWATVTARVESVSETVDTPAGFFDNCVKITYTYAYDSDPGSGHKFVQSITRYFKEDVGIVKMVVERPLPQTETVLLNAYSVTGSGPVPLKTGNSWTYQWMPFRDYEDNTETFTFTEDYSWDGGWDIFH